MFQKKGNKKTSHNIDTSNIIGKGTVLDGNIETQGNIRIEGRVNGSVRSKSKVVLGKSARIEGNIIAQSAEIEGEVKGVAEVSGMLTLKPTAIVHGDISTGKLVVESGATFNGGCKMGVSTKTIKMDNNGQSKAKTLSPNVGATPEVSVV